MSIRTRLTIAVILAFTLAAAGVFGVMEIRRRLDRNNNRHDLVQQMLTKLLALNILRSDYQLYRNERAKRQWESEHAQLDSLLERAKAAFPSGDPMIESLSEANEQRLRLFNSLIATYEAQESGRLSSDTAGDTESRLIGSLLVMSQSAIDDTNILVAKSETDLNSMQAISTSITISLIVLLAIVVLVLSILVERAVLRPLREFERVTQAVGSGDLGYRIGVRRNDEIGRASAAFNSMTEELKEHREGLEDVVTRRTEDLERANVELDAYSRVVSHDLRSPLAAATVANSLLVESIRDSSEAELREQVAETADVVARNLETAHAMVDGLLRIAEAGQRPLGVEDVIISEIVAGIVIEQRAQLDERGIKLDFEADLGTIRANRVQMYQVFSNLIGNSIKHNDNPEPHICIRYLGLDDGAHRYSVCDNGSKLDNGDTEQLFQPFYKSSGRSNTGIGLSIVDKVIRSYNGWIKVSTGNGTCFEFAIPDWEGEQQDA